MIGAEPTWNWVCLYENLGRDAAAESAYRTAIRVEPRMTGPRSNLAALLEKSTASSVRRMHLPAHRLRIEQLRSRRGQAIAA